MDMLVRETGAFGRMEAGPPEHLGVDGAVGGMPASAGKKPVRWLTNRARANIRAALPAALGST